MLPLQWRNSFREPDCSFNMHQNTHCDRWIGTRHMTGPPYQIRKIAGCVSARNAFKGTTHVPWCMLGSPTHCGGERRWHSRRMHNPQFYVPGKSPIKSLLILSRNYWKRCIYAHTFILKYSCLSVRIHIVRTCLCVYAFTFICQIFIQLLGIHVDDNIHIQITDGYNIQPLCSNLVWQPIIKIQRSMDNFWPNDL